MKILVDTSILMAALIEHHPWHARAHTVLEAAKCVGDEVLVCCHSVAETYAGLTTYPGTPRLSPTCAQRLVVRGVLDWCSLVSLEASDYEAAVAHAVSLGLCCGAIYDGLVVQAALKARVDQILTFNVKHFTRLLPDRLVPVLEP